jgi:hypothetical protein
MRVATLTDNPIDAVRAPFQSNATRAGCNNKLAQTKQQVVMHFVQCLSVFLTIQYGRILLTAMESYPFFIIFGAKRQARLYSLGIRTD